jgi:hypothetical protein
MPLPNTLFQPVKPGDPDHAEDLLDEIQGVLRKRGAALLWHESGMVLALPATGSLALQGQWRAIAQAKVISPTEITWRPIGYIDVKPQ